MQAENFEAYASYTMYMKNYITKTRAANVSREFRDIRILRSAFDFHCFTHTKRCTYRQNGNKKYDARLHRIFRIYIVIKDKSGKFFERVFPSLCYRFRKIFNYISDSDCHSLKGGDPAAPSDTATLLRLNPNHWFYLRQLPPCG